MLKGHISYCMHMTLHLPADNAWSHLALTHVAGRTACGYKEHVNAGLNLTVVLPARTQCLQLARPWIPALGFLAYTHVDMPSCIGLRMCSAAGESRARPHSGVDC